ncbi:MAG: LysM peptidoglycan-binding domain-containing protein [Bacteroidales bacterium]|nr:LysM peptidoglycan-binding domain-containing protein [Bacteroidales bacterium]
MQNINKIIGVFILFFSISFSLFSQQKSYPTTKVDGKEFYIYNVGAREGFYSLTRQFNVSQQEIEKYNPETKAGLKDGQRILIPVNPETIATETKKQDSEFTHTVEPGETLNSIARTYGVGVAAIKAMNPRLGEILSVGHSLRIPQPKIAPSSGSKKNGVYIYHTIEPKETLFSVAKKYNVSVQSIIDSNPGLNESSFSIGRIIRINENASQENNPTETPVSKIVYKKYTAEKKDNIYSIARKFEISLTSLLEANPGLSKIKVGQIINIPVVEQTKNNVIANNENSEQVNDILSEISKIKKEERISITLLLPLQLNQHSSSSNGQQLKYVEFYQGFLLAVDSLKNKGVSIDLYVYDTESKDVKTILGYPELASTDLIIGPADISQMKHVTKFGNEHKINVVNPFTFDAEAVENNPYLFQLNTPNSYLYTESSTEFSKLFKDYSIVFLKDEHEANTEKNDFIGYLLHELDGNKQPYFMFEFSDSESLQQVDSLLNLTGETVFVPLSSSRASLSRILPSLRIMQTKNPDVKVSLFGYPIWQTYTKEFMDYFYELNTYIYTRIYVNPFADNTKEFYEKFKFWYGSELLQTPWKYGILGFDTGMFFINALDMYGKNFDAHIDMIPAKSIQTAMCFRRLNNWSGFINRCIYFVNFRPDSSIDRIEVK